jgi:ATP-dependent Clp protease ATP-binding subunit ClpC
VLRVLRCRDRNVPILVGDGADPASVVTALARRVVAGTVTIEWRDARVVALDAPSVGASTRDLDEFTRRLQLILSELRADKEVILFLSEFDPRMAAVGAVAMLGLGQLVVAAAARQFRCVGGLTPSLYRRRVKRHGPLPAPFRPILVRPLSVDDTLQILHGLRVQYSHQHSVSYTDEAMRAAVELSQAQIPNCRLPDTALQVLDLAGSTAQWGNAPLPPNLDPITARIVELQRAKVEAIANQQFEQAAKFRDEAAKLAQGKSELVREWQARTGEWTGVVDVADIAEAVRLLAQFEPRVE